MKLKNKIPLGALATITTICIPIVTVVACSKQEIKDKWKRRNETFENLPWDKFKSYEAEIVDWHDGDTPKIKFIGEEQPTSPVIKDGKVSVRINMIDTPEIGTGGHGDGEYKPTTGNEYKYAKAGKDLADQLMPVGTKVKVATNLSTTYNRIVGNIFFDKDKNGTYESNWSVTIMNAGLALPFVSNPDKVQEETDIIHYIGIPFADAFNYAYENKIGMFSLGEQGIEDMLKNHGSTNMSTVKWHDDNSGMPNIYDYYKDWKDLFG